jgi:hypothetical protein
VVFSFDLDNLDVLSEFYRCEPPREAALERCFENAGDRLLSLLDEFDIPGTFFVIGRDLGRKSARGFLNRCLTGGHEVGNHTQNHCVLSALTPAGQRDEVRACHEAVGNLLGVAPRGFRGGSMQSTAATLAECRRLGYEYDSSVFPTSISFLLFAMAFLNSPCARNLPRWRHLAAGLLPKRPRPADRRRSDSLVLLPVTVVPLIQLPFYATFHLRFPWLYDMTAPLVGAFRRDIVYQGHLLDFVDVSEDGVPENIARYPLLRVALAQRIETYRRIFAGLSRQATAVTCLTLAQAVRKAAAS